MLNTKMRVPFFTLQINKRKTKPKKKPTKKTPKTLAPIHSSRKGSCAHSEGTARFTRSLQPMLTETNHKTAVASEGAWQTSFYHRNTELIFQLQMYNLQTECKPQKDSIVADTL